MDEERNAEGRRRTVAIWHLGKVIRTALPAGADPVKAFDLGRNLMGLQRLYLKALGEPELDAMVIRDAVPALQRALEEIGLPDLARWLDDFPACLRNIS